MGGNGTPITPPWNNSTAVGDGAVVVGGQTGQIEQGPTQLVNLLYSPPAWFETAFWGIILVVVGLATMSAYQHGVPPEAIEEMGEIGIIVVSIWKMTGVVVTHLNLSYLVDVGVGTAAGFVVAKCVIWALYQMSGGRTTSATKS